MKVLLLFVSISMVSSQAAEALSREATLHLTGMVHVLLKERCNECHGDHLKKPDGKFGYVLDLQRIASNPDFIAPRDPTKSEFYRLMQDGEMPPDDHPKTPRLTRDEYDHVRRWILQGCPTELPATLPKLGPKLPIGALNQQAEAIKYQTTQKRVTLKIVKRPVGEILAQIEKLSGIAIAYQQPEKEPVISITHLNAPVYDALRYVALKGNFSLTFNEGQPKIGQNPPPDAPLSLPPVLGKKYREKEAERLKAASTQQ
jgi:hypothetical protein